MSSGRPIWHPKVDRVAKIFKIGNGYYAEPSRLSGIADPGVFTDAGQLANALCALIGAEGGEIVWDRGTFNYGTKTQRDSCDSGWVTDGGANVVVTHDAVVKMEGAASVKLAVGAAFVTGLAAHKTIAIGDISAEQNVGLEFRPSIALATGDVQIVLSQSADCSTEDILINIRHPEGLDANEWKYCKPNPSSEYLLVDLSAGTNIQAVGIKIAVDKGACDLYIDDIATMIGAINITTEKPISFRGQGPKATTMQLNVDADMPFCYSVADWMVMEKFGIYGVRTSQRAIDGNTGIINRYGNYCKYEDLFLDRTKGSGINVRDANHVVGKNIHGYDNENPVVAIFYCDFPDFEIKGRDIANDDPLWAVRTSWGKFKVQAEGGVGNLARIEGVSAELPSIGTEISVSGKDAPNAGLQIGSFVYGTDAKVQVSNCQYGAQIAANALGTRLGGTIRASTGHSVICTGDGTIFDGVNVYLPTKSAFYIYANDCILNGCNGVGDGIGTAWSGVHLDGALRTNINGGSFRLFTRGGHGGIKESGATDYTKAINVQIDGNTNPIYIAGLNSIFSKCGGLNPYGKVATPFDAATNSIEIGGGAAAPVASTDYYVRNMDIVISSSNSGDSNCVILIKDAAGVTVFGPLSSFDPMLIPVGWRINWGAFTGTAPDVPVGFN